MFLRKGKALVSLYSPPIKKKIDKKQLMKKTKPKQKEEKKLKLKCIFLVMLEKNNIERGKKKEFV